MEVKSMDTITPARAVKKELDKGVEQLAKRKRIIEHMYQAIGVAADTDITEVLVYPFLSADVLEEGLVSIGSSIQKYATKVDVVCMSKEQGAADRAEPFLLEKYVEALKKASSPTRSPQPCLDPLDLPWTDLSSLDLDIHPCCKLGPVLARLHVRQTGYEHEGYGGLLVREAKAISEYRVFDPKRGDPPKCRLERTGHRQDVRRKSNMWPESTAEFKRGVASTIVQQKIRFDQSRVNIHFLTPEQMSVWNGPRFQLIGGYAGSGKTLILLTRMKKLMLKGCKVMLIAPASAASVYEEFAASNGLDRQYLKIVPLRVAKLADDDGDTRTGPRLAVSSSPDDDDEDGGDLIRNSRPATTSEDDENEGTGGRLPVTSSTKRVSLAETDDGRSDRKEASWIKALRIMKSACDNPAAEKDAWHVLVDDSMLDFDVCLRFFEESASEVTVASFWAAFDPKLTDELPRESLAELNITVTSLSTILRNSLGVYKLSHKDVLGVAPLGHRFFGMIPRINDQTGSSNMEWTGERGVCSIMNLLCECLEREITDLVPKSADGYSLFRHVVVLIGIMEEETLVREIGIRLFQIGIPITDILNQRRLASQGYDSVAIGFVDETHSLEWPIVIYVRVDDGLEICFGMPHANRAYVARSRAVVGLVEVILSGLDCYMRLMPFISTCVDKTLNPVTGFNPQQVPPFKACLEWTYPDLSRLIDATAQYELARSWYFDGPLPKFSENEPWRIASGVSDMSLDLESESDDED